MPDIFDQLLAETRAAEHHALAGAAKITHAAPRWFHVHPSTSAAPAAALPPPRNEGAPPMPDVLTALHDAISEGVSNLKGWADSLEGQLPELAATAAKYQNSPIIQALEALGDQTLPPGAEQDIANLISRFAPPTTPPATPAPADTAAAAPAP